MRKEEVVFDDIFKKTSDSALSWLVINSSSYSGLIFQPSSVFRIFETKYSRNGENFVVLLVEKKFPDPDWDMELEKYLPELYFLQDGSIVTVLDPDTIDYGKFINLVKLVESKSDKAKKLFG